VRGFLRWAVIAGAAVLAGCPVPIVPHYESGSRYNIGERMPDFIVEGATTRDDLLLHMGEPDGRGPEDRWFTYGSRYNEGGVIFVVGGPGGVGGVGASSIRYRRIVVRFDDRGVVSSAGFVERSCPSVMGGAGNAFGESPACIDVTSDDARAPEAKSASGPGTGRTRTTAGKFATAVVNIAPVDVVAWRAEPTDVQVPVMDRRTNIVMERVVAGTMPMSGVVLQPGETDLITAIVTAKLREAIAAQPRSAGRPEVACELTEFSITTPGTILYWDVTTDIAVTLRVGSEQRSLTAHAVARTYWWPTESLIKEVTVKALKVIATGSGTALGELITSASATAP
jgi:outer membrane protein assembly factor BamE (lipoprotein component of BamABCDE complex)